MTAEEAFSIPRSWINLDTFDKKLTTQELKQKIESGENFILDLYATWCGPCKVMLNNLTKEIGRAHV